MLDASLWISDLNFLGLIAPGLPQAVIPAKAGIQNDTGCRIKSGMTFDTLLLVAGGY